MPKLASSPRIAGAAAAGILLAGLASAAPASAAGGPLHATYTANGTSVVAKPNSTLTLGPATLSLTLRQTGKFTATLPLPDTTSTFQIAGLLPVSATVSFMPAAKLRGAVSVWHNKIEVTSTAKEYIGLSDVSVAGLPVPVGDSCQTSDPVVIVAATPKKQGFDINSGGKLKGTFDIGDFAHCGLTTPLLNQLVPGPGNTIKLVLSDGQIG